MINDGKVIVTKYVPGPAGQDGGGALCLDVPATIVVDGAEQPVMSVGPNAFADSAIASIALPDTVDTIEAEAFGQVSGLQVVYVPSSVKSIDQSAFGDLTNNSSLVLVGEPTDAVREFSEKTGEVTVDQEPRAVVPGGLILASDSRQVRFGENGLPLSDGVRIVVTYEDGTTEVLDDGFIVKPKDAQTATIEYLGEIVDVPAVDVKRSYTLHYIDEDGNAIAPADIAYAPYGEMVIEAPKIEGFKAVQASVHVEISNESNEFELKYRPSDEKIDIAEATITLASRRVERTGEELKPRVAVYVGDKELVEGLDYEVSYCDNVDGEWDEAEASFQAVAYIVGLGNYIGIADASFEIVDDGSGDYLDGEGNVGDRSIEGDINDFNPHFWEYDNAVYDYDYGMAVEPLVYFDADLEEGVDYEVAYFNNVNAGIDAYALVKGIGNCRGEAKLPFTIAALSINGELPSLIKDSARYTGKAIKPGVKFDWDNITDDDYSLVYKNNIAIGTAKVVIRGKGNFNGKKVLPFVILPAKAKIVKLKAAKKAFTVKVKAQKGAKYQFQYSLDESKWVTKKSSKATLKISKLKARRSYSVRARAFAKVGSKVRYGKWSPIEIIKTK